MGAAARVASLTHASPCTSRVKKKQFQQTPTTYRRFVGLMFSSLHRPFVLAPYSGLRKYVFFRSQLLPQQTCPMRLLPRDTASLGDGALFGVVGDSRCGPAFPRPPLSASILPSLDATHCGHRCPPSPCDFPSAASPPSRHPPFTSANLPSLGTPLPIGIRPSSRCLCSSSHCSAPRVQGRS